MSDQGRPLTPHGYEETADELRAAVASAEARTGAMLRAIPDLMFVLRRDGTYVDFHAREPRLLFVPPEQFLGRTVREVLPAPVAEMMMNAFVRVGQRDEPVIVEYELPLDEPRWFEARIVQAGPDLLLSIVRDVTGARRAAELNRDLARRLIASQESERQRLARELHDDLSQRLAMLNIEIDQLAAQSQAGPVRERLRKLGFQVGEIASDVHQMSYELHPSKLQTLGLVAALASLCREMSNRWPLVVSFADHAIPASVHPTISLCLYRIVQEALHNVARHSHARDARVSVTCDSGQFLLEIADAGVGFDATRLPHVGLGLVSMRERVAALNGQLVVEALPGRGTRITARIPFGFQASGQAASVIAATYPAAPTC